VLEADMVIAAPLPCRLAVYQEEGVTKIAAIRPPALPGMFPKPELAPVARLVEEIMSRIMENLAG
jgi:uncharacterized protein (DUF302 family)